MERNLNLLLHGPIFPLVTATAAITLAWILRVRAKRTASYRLMAEEWGEPGRIERLLVGGAVVAMYVLLVCRGVGFFVGEPTG